MDGNGLYTDHLRGDTVERRHRARASEEVAHGCAGYPNKTKRRMIKMTKFILKFKLGTFASSLQATKDEIVYVPDFVEITRIGRKT